VCLQAVVDCALILIAHRLDEERVEVRPAFPDGPVTVEAE